jgi:hypothetical protein
MNTNNYSRTFVVQRTPQQVYDAVNNVRGWWTENTEGPTANKGDAFTVQFENIHRTTQLITEAVRGKLIVWHVTEAHLPWLKDAEEWKGTDIRFEIAQEAEGTRLTFTHVGLVPEVECFEQCEKGWDYFVLTSLFKLLTEGVGQPDTAKHSHLEPMNLERMQNASSSNA